MNIIADVAGQYDALMRLVAIMPKDPFIFVGDLVDRGPNSPQVLNWVSNNARCVLGNHEHMMIDFYRKTEIYHPLDWLENGGDKTAQSYVGRKIYANKYSTHDLIREAIPEDHIEWLESLPTEIRTDNGLLVTHAPYSIRNAAPPMNVEAFIWNRFEPDYVEGYFNVFGHNSHWGLQHIKDHDYGHYAMCIDASSQGVLTGVNWPSLTVFQVPYEKK